MILNSRSVLHYLLDKGLLSSEDLVDGDMMVVEIPRRNRNYQIRSRKSCGLFLKQIQGWEPLSRMALKREAFYYWLSQCDPDFAVLTDAVPKYRLYDPEKNLLVTDLVPGESLQAFHQRERQFPPSIGVSLGRQMATYHRQLGADRLRQKFPASFPAQVPWILSFHQSSPSQLQAFSTGNAQLLDVLRRFPDFPRWFDELRARWEIECLIHGDMKWDNCVVESHSATSVPHRLRLMDWELADLGDPAWDIGAGIQAYLSWWVFSMQPGPGMPPSRFMETAQTPLSAVQPALRSLWSSYCESMGLDTIRGTAKLEHAIRCAAARMTQTAYEHLQFSPQLTHQAICLLQVSLNMLQNPTRAIRELIEL